MPAQCRGAQRQARCLRGSDTRRRRLSPRSGAVAAVRVLAVEADAVVGLDVALDTELLTPGRESPPKPPSAYTAFDGLKAGAASTRSGASIAGPRTCTGDRWVRGVRQPAQGWADAPTSADTQHAPAQVHRSPGKERHDDATADVGMTAARVQSGGPADVGGQGAGLAGADQGGGFSGGERADHRHQPHIPDLAPAAFRTVCAHRTVLVGRRCRARPAGDRSSALGRVREGDCGRAPRRVGSAPGRPW
ncbi:MAG: hypothetical protein JWR58_2092 [Pseudonocardia sp.]|nr:hypothetical protein [Pseudonocardia sp.]